MRCESSDRLAEITLVLVGKTGNGKSATGNCIIGRQVFESMPSLGGIASTCKLETNVLDNGQILNVIDAPGLFDSAVETHEVAKEIAKCVKLAKDGVHAFLLVLQSGNRFSNEAASAFESLFFGGKIADYMIVVFAHGVDLGKNFSLDDLVGGNKPLKSTLKMCGNRSVLFDHRIGDIDKVYRQREELLSLVEAVVRDNGGKPYTNDLFDELNMGEMNLFDHSAEGKSSKRKFHALSEDQFDGLIEMVELRVKESIYDLEKQLATERAARMEADLKSFVLQTKSKDEVESMLKERIRNLEKQLAEERAARRVGEMKALVLQTKSKADVLEMKNRAEESRKQLEDSSLRDESIHNLGKQLTAERASLLEAETKMKDDMLELKACLSKAEESRKQLEDRSHRDESIHNLEKQLAEERASRLEAETKLKEDMLELKACLSKAEESCKQLEDRSHRDKSIHNLEKQLAAERASRLEAEFELRDLVMHEVKDCLNVSGESHKQLEERLNIVESQMDNVLTSLKRMKAIDSKGYRF